MLPRSLALLLLAVSLGVLIAAAVYRVATRRQRDDWRPYGDEGWYGWYFYYHPNDDRLFVPYRVGFGWATNLAQPLAWVISGAMFVAGLALVSVVG